MSYLEVLRWNFGSYSGHLEAGFSSVSLFTQYKSRDITLLQPTASSTHTLSVHSNSTNEYYITYVAASVVE